MILDPAVTRNAALAGLWLIEHARDPRNAPLARDPAELLAWVADIAAEAAQEPKGARRIERARQTFARLLAGGPITPEEREDALYAMRLAAPGAELFGPEGQRAWRVARSAVARLLARLVPPERNLKINWERVGYWGGKAVASYLGAGGAYDPIYEGATGRHAFTGRRLEEVAPPPKRRPPPPSRPRRSPPPASKPAPTPVVRVVAKPLALPPAKPEPTSSPQNNREPSRLSRSTRLTRKDRPTCPERTVPRRTNTVIVTRPRRRNGNPAVQNTAAALTGGVGGALASGLLVRQGVKVTTATVGVAAAGRPWRHDPQGQREDCGHRCLCRCRGTARAVLAPEAAQCRGRPDHRVAP